MEQITLDEWAASRTFHGKTYDAKRDKHRLSSQYALVFALMADGKWRTLREISDAVGKGSEASISARLRDFRKPENGGHTVEHRLRGNQKEGLWEYRLVVRNL